MKKLTHIEHDGNSNKVIKRFQQAAGVAADIKRLNHQYDLSVTALSMAARLREENC